MGAVSHADKSFLSAVPCVHLRTSSASFSQPAALRESSLHRCAASLVFVTLGAASAERKSACEDVA